LLLPVLLVTALLIWGLVEILRRGAIWLWHWLQGKFAMAC
jgi:hypothetical protein